MADIQINKYASGIVISRSDSTIKKKSYILSCSSQQFLKHKN